MVSRLEQDTDTEFLETELNVVRLEIEVDVKVRKVPEMGALLASHWLSLSQPFHRITYVTGTLHCPARQPTSKRT
jgi:hypothetical protein